MKLVMFYAQIALVMNAPRSASARAATYCDILSLDRKALNSVIHHFPDGKCNLAPYTKNLIKN